MTTAYVGDYYEYASTVKKYYSIGGVRVAMDDNGTVRYLLTDHLGSTAKTATGSTETGELRHKAWGESRWSSGTTPTAYHFTGQREDVSIGLYFYGARWYDPALGRCPAPQKGRRILSSPVFTPARRRGCACRRRGWRSG